MDMNTEKLYTAGRILDSIGDGVYVTDNQRRIVYWNKAARTITGWEKGRVLGSSCKDGILCHVDKQERPLCGESDCPLFRAISTGKPSASPIIVYAQKSDGSRLPVQVTVAPVYNDQQEIIGGVEVFRDFSGAMEDLVRARRIQQQALKWQTDSGSLLKGAVHYIPHDMIGGDFYAVEQINEHQTVFLLADVMGHGTSAALYTMYLRSLFDAYHSLIPDLQPFMGTLNKRLYQLMNGNFSFAASICGVIDTRKLELQITGGTQTPVLLYPHGGSVHKLIIRGYLLGMMEDAEYPVQKQPFKPGDTLFLFTDGAIENKGATGLPIGDQGLISILDNLGYPLNPSGLPEVEKKLVEQSADVSFNDDVTLLEFRWMD